MSKLGILINNIGSPADSNPDAVGRYLKEFLMDEEILNIPYLIRYALVNFLIVPRRKFASSIKYKKVWGKKESPLIELSKSFTLQLQEKMGDAFVVRLGMRYGEPSLKQALADMKAHGVEQIFLAPMYPQYAAATHLSVEKEMLQVFKTVYPEGTPKQITTLQPFFEWPDFLKLSAEKLKNKWQTKEWDHVLFSFHSLPESHVKKFEGCLQSANCCDRAEACALNCYRAQCVSTARAIATLTGLSTSEFSISFQSRLGPAKWLQPASIDIVAKLAQQGSKKLLVQSPSFVTDCLETLEEISMELCEEFQKYGGDDLKLVACLNDDAEWVDRFANYVQQQFSFRSQSMKSE